MPKKIRNYFITPTRLTKHKHFHKTIKMMDTLSEDASIIMPESTVTWLHNGGWHTIAAENAFLCLGHDTREYSWAENVVAANVLFELFFEKKEHVDYALASHVLYEQRLNRFIKEGLPPVFKGMKKEIKRYHSHYGSEFVSSILSNESIKTYHYSMLMDLIPKSMIGKFSDNFASYGFEKMPDHVFEIVMDYYTSAGDSYYNNHQFAILTEAMSRGMLVRAKKYATTLARQVEPTFEDPKPVPVEEKKKVPTKFKTFAI